MHVHVDMVHCVVCTICTLYNIHIDIISYILHIFTFYIFSVYALVTHQEGYFDLTYEATHTLIFKLSLENTP